MSLPPPSGNEQQPAKGQCSGIPATVLLLDLLLIQHSEFLWDFTSCAMLLHCVRVHLTFRREISVTVPAYEQQNRHGRW